jgi:hypothetical protein
MSAAFGHTANVGDRQYAGASNQRGDFHFAGRAVAKSTNQQNGSIEPYGGIILLPARDGLTEASNEWNGTMLRGSVR